MEGSSLPRPNRRQARRLAVSLMVFWALWAALASQLGANPPNGALLAPAVVLAMGAGWTFYLTLFDVWRERTGRSAWRMLLVPSFGLQRARWQAMTALFRPSWIRSTLRATEWPVTLLAAILVALLAVDLALVVWLFTHVVPNAAPRRAG